MTGHPVLYSFRRCPYAIRARMTLAYADVPVELREVLLKDKPPAMLALSQKGTVPVLALPDGRVIDESIDVMRWTLGHRDPNAWLTQGDYGDRDPLITENDGRFKTCLDKYKYADRHPEHPPHKYREEACSFLRELEWRLSEAPWLGGQQEGFADIAIFPFIRQFAGVDRAWFDESPYPHLRRWLDSLLDHPLFKAVMAKHPPWTPGQTPVIFPEDT
ncbi:glutathione S-transferase [Congregibacter litoralis]|uniref:Glutathione S-transferase n=1 Tax=Congregibacter litoralis KT71 TaxID=314285 RepID=A4AAT5_9GAMM|nr:glutathione S-transferase [Congregibacter litoralis]EAQ96807.2 Glutathione S-transferase [Congregibacter litoralis KT71]